MILQNTNHENWIQVAQCQLPWCEDEIIPLMVEALSAQNEEVVARAATFFQHLRFFPSAKEGLLGLLKHPSRWVRYEAVVALQHFKDKRVVDKILELLAEPITYTSQIDWENGIGISNFDDSNVQNALVQTLGEIGDKRAATPIIKMLNNQDKQFVQVAVSALGTIRSKKAVKPLINLLDDADEIVQKQTIKALTTIGDARAIQPLIQLLFSNSKNSYSLASQIIDALEKFGTSESLFAIEQWKLLTEA